MKYHCLIDLWCIAVLPPLEWKMCSVMEFNFGSKLKKSKTEIKWSWNETISNRYKHFCHYLIASSKHQTTLKLVFHLADVSLYWNYSLTKSFDSNQLKIIVCMKLLFQCWLFRNYFFKYSCQVKYKNMKCNQHTTSIRSMIS